MSITVHQIDDDRLPLYDAIPSRFQVRAVWRVETIDGGIGGFRLVEEAVSEPYMKYYDDGDGPSNWADRFDLSAWGIFLAIDRGRPAGGTAVAIGAPMYPMDRFQREDLAVLWDIRVHPDHQRRGIGSALFQHAADWARRKGCSQLGIETQNVNVPACRFYAGQGATLGAIHRHGYAGCPDVAHEAMLLWYLHL